MPTKRKLISRNRTMTAGGLTAADFLYFTWGDFFDAEDYEDGKSEADLQAFWKTHSSAIMERYMAELKIKRWAGRRPWSWWRWSAPPEQKKIIPGGEEVWDERRVRYGPYESDFKYLERLNLLQDWEKAGNPEKVEIQTEEI